jgi:hypothetical protein
MLSLPPFVATKRITKMECIQSRSGLEKAQHNHMQENGRDGSHRQFTKPALSGDFTTHVEGRCHSQCSTQEGITEEHGPLHLLF